MVPIVFTMGKVGSTATRRALTNAGLLCFDLHSLRYSEPATVLRWHAQITALHDAGVMTANNVVFISLVREPVSRNLSGYFQNLSRRFPDRIPEAEEAVKVFLEQYSHKIPENWFKREWIPHTGIDPYRQSFDLKEGYKIYGEPVRAVIMRADLADQKKSKILSQIFGQEIELKRDNVGSHKSYSKLYLEICNSGIIPEEYVQEQYSTNFAQHFWSGDEREALVAKWTGKGSPDL